MAPSGIEYNREKDTLISVKWNSLTPDKALGRVLNYTISYRISDKKRDAETILKVTGAEERQAVIDGLDAGTGYTMSMWANTSAGKGKESTSVLVEGTRISHKLAKPNLHCRAIQVVIDHS